MVLIFSECANGAGRGFVGEGVFDWPCYLELVVRLTYYRGARELWFPTAVTLCQGA